VLSTQPLVLLPHRLKGNLYVDEIGNAYKQHGLAVVYGPENLLKECIKPDLLHLHWPEELYRWHGEGSREQRGEHAIAILHSVRTLGCRIVWTVHNIGPHEMLPSGIDQRVYNAVADVADVIVHHCPISRDLICEAYPQTTAARHLVIPHGHYFGYPNAISRKEARSKLQISEDAFVYLQFGNIRFYKGIDLLLGAYRAVRTPRKYLVIAGQYQTIGGHGALVERLNLARLRYLTPRTLIHPESIPSERVQDYLQAADCVVLSHMAGLNSGVAVLGMTFGKPVVAPSLGCIDWVLSQGINVTYEPGNVRALADAMDRAARLDQVAVTTANREAAQSWDWLRGVGTILRELRVLGVSWMSGPD